MQNEQLHSIKHECQSDMFVYYILHPLNYMGLSDFPLLQLQLVNTAQYVYLGAKNHLVTGWKSLNDFVHIYYKITFPTCN